MLLPTKQISCLPHSRVHSIWENREEFEPNRFFVLSIYGVGMGMGMANQLELISVYACCSTRAAMMFMEGGDIVPYVGHYLPNWLIIRQNYECWVLNKGRSNRQDRQAGHGRARGLKSVHDCSCFYKVRYN